MRDQRLEADPAAMRESLDRVQLMSLGPAAWLLGTLFLVMTVIDPWLEPGGRAATVAADGLEVGVALLWLGIGGAIAASRLPARLAPRLAGLASLAVAANSLAHLLLLHLPEEAETFPLIALGGAVVLTSRRWFYALLAGCFAGIAMGAGMFPDFYLGAPGGERTVSSLVVTVLALVTFRTRLSVLGRLEAVRLQEARQRVHLEETLAALREAERIRGVFVHSITHDLRSPLTAISGFAEFLDVDPLTERQEEFAGHIQRSARQLSRLVDDLMDYARLEGGSFHLMCGHQDLAATVRNAVEAMRPEAELGRVHLELEVSEEKLEADFDAQRITQVLTNLVGNAIKFSPAGATIRVAAGRADDGLTCAVSDDGPGIPEEEQQRLFEPFVQLEGGAKRRGAGLGLAIGKSIVEAHGGRIDVTSRPGSGSTFSFTLPGPVPLRPGEAP